MDIQRILEKAIALDASDIFLVAGLPVTYKCFGRQIREGERLLPDGIYTLVEQIYDVGDRDRTNLDHGHDDDFALSVFELGRFRVNVFRQRGSHAAVIRVIHFGLPDPEKLASLAETDITESLLSENNGSRVKFQGFLLYVFAVMLLL